MKPTSAMIGAAHDVTMKEAGIILSHDLIAKIYEAMQAQAAPHPAITHCDNCGCDWLDNGLNPIGCPYCKQPVSPNVVGMPEFDSLLDHIYECGTAAEGVIEKANALARAVLAKYAPQQPAGVDWPTIVEGLRLADHFFDGDDRYSPHARKVRAAYRAALAQQPAAVSEESSKGADAAQPKRRRYDPSGSLSEYGIFPECDAQPLESAPPPSQEIAMGKPLPEAVVEAVARAICVACEENPDRQGDARGNEFRWQDYRDTAVAAISAFTAAKQPADDEVVFIDGVGAARSSIKSCHGGVQWIRVGDRVYWPLSDSDAKRLQSACCGNGHFDGPTTPAGEGEQQCV